MLKGSKKSLLSVAFLAAALTGCASVGVVDQSDRATSGQYDGAWLVEVQKGAGVQYVNQWQMNCGDMRNTISMSVKDGIAQFGNNQDNLKTAVSESGRFKLVVPLGDIASESGTSDGTMDNGNVKVILRGSLGQGKAKGHITYGIAELGYGGCTAKTRFKRQNSSSKPNSA